jgi:serine/threonine protein kinase
MRFFSPFYPFIVFYLTASKDLKPENLLLDTEGRCKIADFGVSQLLANEEEAADAPSQRRDSAGRRQRGSGAVTGQTTTKLMAQIAQQVEAEGDGEGTAEGSTESSAAVDGLTEQNAQSTAAVAERAVAQSTAAVAARAAQAKRRSRRSLERIASRHMLKDTAGTYHFLAPECLSGELYDGYQADVWALGVTMYALLFGMLPFGFDAYDPDDDAASGDAALGGAKDRKEGGSDSIGDSNVGSSKSRGEAMRMKAVPVDELFERIQTQQLHIPDRLPAAPSLEVSDQGGDNSSVAFNMDNGSVPKRQLSRSNSAREAMARGLSRTLSGRWLKGGNGEGGERVSGFQVQ